MIIRKIEAARGKESICLEIKPLDQIALRHTALCRQHEGIAIANLLFETLPRSTLLALKQRLAELHGGPHSLRPTQYNRR